MPMTMRTTATFGFLIAVAVALGMCGSSWAAGKADQGFMLWSGCLVLLSLCGYLMARLNKTGIIVTTVLETPLAMGLMLSALKYPHGNLTVAGGVVATFAVLYAPFLGNDVDDRVDSEEAAN